MVFQSFFSLALSVDDVRIAEERHDKWVPSDQNLRHDLQFYDV